MHISALIKYLRLPLHTAPLLVILIFAFLASLALGQGYLVGIPTLLILASWFFKYSFVLLDHVVDGKHDPPALAPEMINPAEQRPLGILIVLGVAYWATMMLEASWNEKSILMLRIGFLLIVPAMVAAMSITGRFIDALNPVTVFGMIARMPWGYVQLLIVIAVLWFTPWFAVVGLGFVPPIFFSLALSMYLWLAMCSCIGGIVYEQRMELGYEPVHSPERTAVREQTALERERDKIMDTIFAEVRGGAFANAGASVRKLIEDSSDPLNEFCWMYARASQWPDQRLADYLAQLGLPRLIDARATGEALDIVRERLRSNPNFRPTIGAELLRVAMLARDAGDRTTARALLQDFDRHYPNNAARQIAAKLSADLSNR